MYFTEDKNRTRAAIMGECEGEQLFPCEAEQEQKHQGSVQGRTQRSLQFALIQIFRYGFSFPFLFKFEGIF